MILQIKTLKSLYIITAIILFALGVIYESIILGISSIIILVIAFFMLKKLQIERRVK